MLPILAAQCCPCARCFSLTSCDDASVIYTQTDLTTYVGDYVTISGHSARYLVATSDDTCPSPVSVTVDGGPFSGCAVTCGNCNTVLACGQYQIVISGVVNGTSSDSANVNGTFILTSDPVVPSFFQSDACFWKVPLGLTLGNGADTLGMAIFGPASSLTGTLRIQFYVAGTSTLKGPSYSDVRASTRTDCLTMSSFSAPFTAGDVPNYDASASTCLVTALC